MNMFDYVVFLLVYLDIKRIVEYMFVVYITYNRYLIIV